MWEKIAGFIREHQSFLLTTHLDPEGDAIGSEIALKMFLEDIGKRAFIVNSSKTPGNCEFLDPQSDIMVYPESYRPDILDDVDGFIILDVNSWKHIGEFTDVIRKSSKPRICIDHHQGFDKNFTDIFVYDTYAAATGVLIYELIRHMKGQITHRIAEALYASLITDTGTFRFSNTDARAFTIAAELYNKGADPFRIHRRIFASRSWGTGHLLGPVLSTVDSAAEGKIVWIHVTREMFEKASAVYEDSDGLLELVRGIKGVELCLFFKETVNGKIKISVRSNGKVNAYRIANQLGGGGHKMAAGIIVDGPMDQAIKEVVGACLKAPDLGV